MAICELCLRGRTRVLNRPHSLKRTKRSVLPNLQKVGNVLVCSKCRRTLNKVGCMDVNVKPRLGGDASPAKES